MTLAKMATLFSLVISTFGCSAPQQDLEQRLDDALREQIVLQNLTGNPAEGLDIPDIESPKAQLGMKLFFSKTLGGELDTACVSCHHPMLGGGDNLSLPVGTGAQQPEVIGHGRAYFSHLPALIPRNSPTTFNTVLWKRHIFHDGRIQQMDTGIATPDKGHNVVDELSGHNLVQAQARFPITSFDEMRGGQWIDKDSQTVRIAIADRLRENWSPVFAAVLNKNNHKDLINDQNFTALLAEYERSQLFIENPWKQYVEGDTTAITTAAKRGALLFLNDQASGGAGCSSCHSGDFFTNEEFYNVGIPQIGPGKGNGIRATADFGCSLFTHDKKDRFKFRTPSLLNVEVTGPWGHNGAYTSLETITKHMLDPAISADNYDMTQLTQPGIHLDDVRANTRMTLKQGLDIEAKPNLEAQDVSDVVEFLKSLTDPCVKSRECMAPWIPKLNANDPDGRMLHAKSVDGNLL